MASAENYTQAPNFINPNNYHPQEERELMWTRFGKWALKKMGEHKLPTGIGVGALVGAVATSAVVGLSHDKSTPSTLQELNNSGPAATGSAFSERQSLPSTLDLNHDGTVNGADFDLMPPQEYFNWVPEWAQLNDVVPKLHKYMPGTLTNIEPYLSKDEKKVLSMPDLSKPRIEWSDQDYANYFTIAYACISGQGTRRDQIEEGQRALPMVMDPANNDFNKTLNNIKGLAIRNVYQALSSPLSGVELRPGTQIDGQTITNEGGRLVLAKFISDNNEGESFAKYLFFINKKDDKGNITSPLVEEYDPSDPVILRLTQ